MADVIAPHFDIPFRMEGGLRAAVVEQDSIDDITNCVQMVLRTELGSRRFVPTFGIKDLGLAPQPLPMNKIADQIVKSEPRALVALSQQPDLVDSLIDYVLVEVTHR